MVKEFDNFIEVTNSWGEAKTFIPKSSIDTIHSGVSEIIIFLKSGAQLQIFVDDPEPVCMQLISILGWH